MIKKIFSLSLITLFYFNATQAQIETTASSSPKSLNGYGEIGINAMRLITLGNSTTTTNWNPYLFTAEGGLMNIGARVGFAQFVDNHTEFPVGVNGYTRADVDSSKLDYRIGLFYTFHPDEKWSFKIGADYYVSQIETMKRTEYKAATTNFLVIQEQNITDKESGFAPFVNIQYHITPRVGIGTELIYRMGSMNRDERATDTQVPEVVERKYEAKRTYFILPTAVFLTMRF